MTEGQKREMANAQGYADMFSMPTELLERNMKWAERMEKAWGEGKATNNLRTCVCCWKDEIDRRNLANNKKQQ